MGNSVKKWSFLLLFTAFIWGTTFAVMKDLLESMYFLNFLFLRFLIAGLFFAFLGRKLWKNLKPIDYYRALVLAFILFIGYITQVWGLMYTTASQAGFITGLYVVIVPLIAIAMKYERARKETIIGTVLALAGLYLLTGGGSLRFGQGEMLVFICAVAFALYIVYLGLYAAKIEAIPFIGLQMILTAILMGIAALLFAPYNPWQISYITLEQWLPIIYMALVATGFAYFWEHRAQQILSSSFTALAFATEPVFAALFAFFYLQELLPPLAYLGGALIFAGMILASRAEHLNYKERRSIKSA